MMKHGYTWAGIIGALLVLFNSGAVISSMAHPTDLVNVSTALYLQNGAYIALGVFLITLFLKGRARSEAMKGAVITAEPDSSEDIERLRKNRNWTMGFVILIMMIGSIPAWTLNDYTAGLTIINIAIIWDVLFNAILLYIVILLFRGKPGVEKILLYAIIPYFVVSAGLVYSIDWSAIISNALMLVYFVTSIKVPLNRKSFRFTQLILLPAIFILMNVTPVFSNAKLDQLARDLNFQLAQYTADKTQVSSDFSLFLQSSAPTKSLIENIKSGISTKEKQIDLVLNVMDAMQAQYEARISNIFQQQQLSLLKKEKALIDITREQDAVIIKLMDYASGVNFAYITQKQEEDMNALMQQIYSLDKEIQIAAYKIDNPI